jgi:hypothetical protein
LEDAAHLIVAKKQKQEKRKGTGTIIPHDLVLPTKLHLLTFLPNYESVRLSVWLSSGRPPA